MLLEPPYLLPRRAMPPHRLKLAHEQCRHRKRRGRSGECWSGSDVSEAERPEQAVDCSA